MPVNAYFLCLMAAVAADGQPQTWQPVYTPTTGYHAVTSPSQPVTVSTRYINVAQNQTYQGEPQAPLFSPEALPPQSQPGTVPEYEYLTPGQPMLAPEQQGPALWDPRQSPSTTYDPFMGAPPECQSCPPQGYYQQQGVYGPVPYRLGWTFRSSVTWMPEESTTAGGDLEIFGVDASLQHQQLIGPDWVFSNTPQFGLRTFEGPTGVGLPGSAFRFGWDFELAMPMSYTLPWTLKLGFNPQLASDFEDNPSSDAFQWDGRLVLHHQMNREWGIILGVEYWDRVDDYVIPHVGMTWMPNQLWEMRLAFPETRISYFLGADSYGHPIWIYARAQYQVEAFEVQLQPGSVREQVEFQDWRFLFGLRKEAGMVSGFIEAGWIFDRDVDFKYATPDFEVHSGFITRIGLRY